LGELYYEVAPRLNITLGLRQYWLKQSQLQTTQTGLLFGPEGLTTPTISNKESGLIPKAVISYEFGDRGNVYVSAAKGFRPGSPALPLPDFCAEPAAELGITLDGSGYKSDTLWSYEVGAKSRLSGGRINMSAAAFRMDWTDIQQTITLRQPCGLIVTANAGKARIDGGELEIGGQPFADVPFTLQLGVGYTDAKLIDPGLLAQAPNTSLAFVPKWTASISGYYETPISSSVDFFVAADYSYTSSAQIPRPLQDDAQTVFTTRPPINLVNGNFGFKFAQSQLMFFVKNLFDKRLTYGAQPAFGFERIERLPDGSYTGESQPRGVVTRPRQVGVQYQLNF
jgi:outer membrane receptor protein involved in Fe transport